MRLAAAVKRQRKQSCIADMRHTLSAIRPAIEQHCGLQLMRPTVTVVVLGVDGGLEQSIVHQYIVKLGH